MLELMKNYQKTAFEHKLDRKYTYSKDFFWSSKFICTYAG